MNKAIINKLIRYALGILQIFEVLLRFLVDSA